MKLRDQINGPCRLEQPTRDDQGRVHLIERDRKGRKGNTGLHDNFWVKKNI